MDLRLKTRQILKFIFFSFVCYGIIILIFAWLYFTSGSIELTPYSKPFNEKIDFSKAIYFSIVSFHTIGFGDIHPITSLGRTLVMIQSILSLFFTSVFSGFLVFFIIRRPNDIFATKKIYIRFRNDKYWLSIRLGNKGRAIIDLKGKFEAWTIEHNSRIRAFQWSQELPDLERILYIDIPLDEHHRKLQNVLQLAIREGKLIHMKFSVIGNDIKSGEQVAYTKYFSSVELDFGTIFQNVYSWDANGRRKDFIWKNFEKIDQMDRERKEGFMNLK